MAEEKEKRIEYVVSFKGPNFGVPPVALFTNAS